MKNFLVIFLFVLVVFDCSLLAQVTINRSDIPEAIDFYMPIGDRNASISDDLIWDVRPGTDDSTYLFPGEYIDSAGIHYSGWYVAANFNTDSTYDGYCYDQIPPICVDYHPGEDWNGNGGTDTELGQPVYAMATGRVIYTQASTGDFGNMVQVVHRLSNGQYILSFYAHLDTVLVGMGDLVYTGTQLGTVGNSGTLYAHLHWEIRRDGFLDLTDANTVSLKNSGSYTVDAWPGSDSVFIGENYYSPSEFVKNHYSIGDCPGSGSYHFNGIDQGLTTSSSNPDYGNQGTIEAWFCIDSITDTTSSIYSDWDINPHKLLRLFVNSEGRLELYRAAVVGVPTQTLVSNMAIDTGIWYYVAAIWEVGNVSKIYINGTEDVVSGYILDDLNNNSSLNIQVGYTYYNSNYQLPFKGRIDEIRVSNVVRTASEILDHYINKNELVSDTNTILLWHMNGVAGTFIKLDNAQGNPIFDLVEINGPQSDTGFNECLSCCIGITGNVNGDLSDIVDISDLTYLINYLFFSSAEPPCLEEADMTGDDSVDISDLTYLINYLFGDPTGPEPPACF